jgi:tRNA (guanine10-N2)-dimethyltransferase
VLGDAKRLPLRNATLDGAVLDTPYGRSAKILADSKELLLVESLGELFRVIKPGRRMVIVADRGLDDMLANARFKIIQKHTDRVHGSLTRHIFVCQKAEDEL